MQQEQIIKNNRYKRIIVASLLSLISLILGLVLGIKIKSNKTLPSTLSETDQFVELLKNRWYSDIYYGQDCNEDILIDQFVGALSTSDKVRLDPYTYITKNESSSTIESGKLGVTITYLYNYPLVVRVNEYGACYGKLKEGDLIVSSGKNNPNEYSIVDDTVNYSNILSLVLGKPNDIAYLKVARFENDVLHFFDYEITLSIPSILEYSYLEDEDINDTIMVKLTGFTSSKTANDTCNQLKTILTRNPSKNLILDIRDNGGGDLSSVINICDLFLPKNKLVTTLVYKSGARASHYTTNDEMFSYDNIIILQNSNSASASEILISTLTYYYPNKVVLVGEKSYGKGIAQTKIGVLNNQYTLQYTCAKWLRPDDTWIGMNGSYYQEGYMLGFTPESDNITTKNDVLKTMEANNQFVGYKTNSTAYKVDEVSSINKYFFEIYNALFNSSCRTDSYFDVNCANEILSFQSAKGLEATGLMNEETFLYFSYMFYQQRVEYSNSYLAIAKRIIEG